MEPQFTGDEHALLALAAEAPLPIFDAADLTTDDTIVGLLDLGYLTVFPHITSVVLTEEGQEALTILTERNPA